MQSGLYLAIIPFHERTKSLTLQNIPSQNQSILKLECYGNILKLRTGMCKYRAVRLPECPLRELRQYFDVQCSSDLKVNYLSLKLFILHKKWRYTLFFL